jgi:hypothetical protein
MTKDEALKLALSALEVVLTPHGGTRAHVWDSDEAKHVANAYQEITDALAQPNRFMHPELKQMWEDYFDKCFAAFAKDHAKLFEDK